MPQVQDQLAAASSAGKPDNLVHDQLAVGKPDNLEPGVVRRMADSPQPPWKFWLRVGSAAVGVGVGWLMFPVW